MGTDSNEWPLEDLPAVVVKVAPVLGVTVIHPSHSVAGTFLDDYRTLWADPGLAIFGIRTNCRYDDVLDASFGFIPPGAPTSGLQVYLFVLGALRARTARMIAARHLVPVVFVRVSERSARSAVAALDVLDSPANLRLGVGKPVRTLASHLGARKCLRDAVGTGTSV